MATTAQPRPVRLGERVRAAALCRSAHGCGAAPLEWAVPWQCIDYNCLKADAQRYRRQENPHCLQGPVSERPQTECTGGPHRRVPFIKACGKRFGWIEAQLFSSDGVLCRSATCQRRRDGAQRPQPPRGGRGSCISVSGAGCPLCRCARAPRHAPAARCRSAGVCMRALASPAPPHGTGRGRIAWQSGASIAAQQGRGRVEAVQCGRTCARTAASAVSAVRQGAAPEPQQHWAFVGTSQPWWQESLCRTPHPGGRRRSQAQPSQAAA